VSYLLNTWYAAGWSDAIGASLTPITMLDQALVLFRDSAGRVRVMSDRCPHRFAPLHLGTLCGDRVQCAYHGLQFDGEGRCVHNPHGDGAIPKAALLRTFPVIEMHTLVWVWMGEPARADPALVPDFAFLTDPDLVTNKGYLHGSGHYELYSDNIMDLGHAEFLHPGLGAPAFTKGKRDIYQKGNTVWSNVGSLNDFLSPLHASIKQLEGQRLDWWVDVRWDLPASMELTLYVDEVGGSRESAKWLDRGCHVMTPETATSTHYFWANCRNYRRDDQALTQAIQAGFEAAFENEDKPMIAAQAAMMGDDDFWSLNPVLLAGDAGGVRARRLLAKLIADEAAGREPTEQAIAQHV
jgi:phenylpropionate dioxygenase-like ring-hydroxylating dioxygenase large terminal subunit